MGDLQQTRYDPLLASYFSQDGIYMTYKSVSFIRYYQIPGCSVCAHSKSSDFKRSTDNIDNICAQIIQRVKQ